MVMEGIYSGLPRKMHRPIADGIVGGLKKDLNPSIRANETKVNPSATQFSAGVFGGGPTPQGDGDGKSGGKMKMASAAAGSKKRAAKLEEHIMMHNK